MITYSIRKNIGTSRRLKPISIFERMKNMVIAITIVQLCTCLFLITVVLLQSGKRSGLSGAISGAAETFLTKNKAKTWDGRLAKLTKWVAGVFVLLTLILNMILA